VTSGSPLPDLLSGERRELTDANAGRISVYVDGPAIQAEERSGPPQPPILLVHSINAAASAHEIKPIYDAFKRSRRTYAIDLPGYGHSERSERPYLQPLMVDALTAVIDSIRDETGAHAVDALAVSLSCEFLAKTARAAPEKVRSLALVSPTGFSRNTATHGPPEASRGSALAYRFLTLPLLGRGLFRLLTTPPSIRFFLRKTWGRKTIDEEMFRNSCRVSREPGAHRAPFHFLSGYLFSADIPSVYSALGQPVWLSHGVRGDFTDFSRAAAFVDRPNWRVTRFESGALPYFEHTEAFLAAYEDFLSGVERGEVKPPVD
jgi:pimeloyl-ACP methyl ester carboxylesterase